ncbi:MAG: hypothetical protein ACJA2Y_001431 [Cycloclasticus pugetii]|jgi:hypothetical protein|uniref:hypothetical protein n=1 Tax=Cycloclasticus pugetii TaxID=34068 RepID=UPI0039E4C26F
MQCFARWEKDDEAGVYFRDQTILQFGNNWDFLASFILLNPGSALPLNDASKTDYLRSKELPFFVEPEDWEKYVEFSIDRLMLDVLKLFSANFDGGTIRLYNLFNLKNQDSGEAVVQFKENMKHKKMFASDSEIKFCNAPVIVASGGNAKDPALKEQLIRHIKMAPSSNLFALTKQEPKKFQFTKVKRNTSGFVESYHPSYTFKYGNSTEIGELRT